LFTFNAGIQIYRAGNPGLGPELQHWNEPLTWKDTYEGLAEGLFCFAQDLFGVQFAITNEAHVIRFDPETARRDTLGDSLEAWADWLLSDPDLNGVRAFATAWQDEHGPLEVGKRLIPWRFFTFGGAYDFTNLTAKPAAECMRIRGPFAQQLHHKPDGAHLRLSTTPPQH
jgi:hypothetical protein